MIKITRFFYVHALVLPLIFISFLAGSPTTFFITYGVVLLHELCHLMAALILGVPVYSIILMPFGMTLRLSPHLIKEPKKEIGVALAGPFSNILMLVFGFLFWDPANLNFLIYTVASAAVLAINLLPIPPLDGGRVARALMIHKFGLIPGIKFMRRLSFLLIALLAAAGIFLLIFFRGNTSLIIIAAFLCYNLISEKKNGEILAMRMMIYEKESLRRSGFIPTKQVTLHKSAPAKAVFRKLNFSSFYIVTVLDDNLSVQKVITESDIVRAITSKGYNLTVGQCL